MTESEYRKAVVGQLKWIYWALAVIAFALGFWLPCINRSIQENRLSLPGFPWRVAISTEEKVWGFGGPIKVEVVSPPIEEDKNDG